MVNVPAQLRGELLGYAIGRNCGGQISDIYTFINADRAFNTYYSIIVDQIKQKGWPVPSKDAIDRQFHDGYKAGELERRRNNLRESGIII